MTYLGVKIHTYIFKSHLNISHYLSIMSTRKLKTRYDYNILKQYCDENNIVLTKDYSKEKINRETIIEANCLNCSGDVIKSYRYFLIYEESKNKNKKG